MALDESTTGMVGSGTVVRQAAIPSKHAMDSVVSACLPVLLFTSINNQYFSFDVNRLSILFKNKPELRPSSPLKNWEKL